MILEFWNSVTNDKIKFIKNSLSLFTQSVAIILKVMISKESDDN